MPKSKSRKKKSPKRVLALPDLEQAKTAVLNSLTSASGQRTYEHAIRVRRLVLLGAASRIPPHRRSPLSHPPRATPLRARYHQSAAGSRPSVADEAADSGLLSPELAAGTRRLKGVDTMLGVRLGNWLTPEQGRRLLEHPTPSTPRALCDDAMVAMLIGCGLRRAELPALTLESVQQREEHWVIADWLERVATCARCRSQAGSKMRSMPGLMLSTLRMVGSSAPSTRPGAWWATACLRRCSGTWSGQRQGGLASRSSHRTTSVARVRDSVTWLAVNWIRFDSCWATSRSRRCSATLDANSDYDAR